MKRRHYFGMALSLLAAAVMLSLSQNRRAAPAASTTATAATATSGTAGPAAAEYSFRPLLVKVGGIIGLDVASSPAMVAEREDSLRDTEIDGDVRQDGHGRLIVDRSLRRSFDYFLQHVGEKSGATIRAELAQWLSSRQHLSEATRQEALVWFDKYIDVQRAGTTPGIGGDLAAVTVAFDKLQALRRERLGAEVAAAWFGDEERQDRQTLARLLLARDSTLDDKERARQLWELAQKEQWSTESDGASSEFAMRQSREMDQAGLDAESRLQQRTAIWGEAAAQRLATLDLQQADWNNRLADYSRQRTAIENDNRLSAADRNIRLQGLLQAFDAPEQRRLAALAQAGLLPR